MHVRKTNLPTLDPSFELRKKRKPKKNQKRESTLAMPLREEKDIQVRQRGARHANNWGITSLPYAKLKNDIGSLMKKYKKKHKQKKSSQVGRPRKI